MVTVCSSRVLWFFMRPAQPRCRHHVLMRRLVALLALTVVGQALVACGNDKHESTLTVEGTVSLCHDTGTCTDLPAAGAAVRVFDGAGREVGKGTLDGRGRRDFTVPAGTYTATLSMPGLGVHTKGAQSPRVNVAGQDDAGLLAIGLPPVNITG